MTEAEYQGAVNAISPTGNRWLAIDPGTLRSGCHGRAVAARAGFCQAKACNLAAGDPERLSQPPLP